MVGRRHPAPDHRRRARARRHPADRHHQPGRHPQLSLTGLRPRGDPGRPPSPSPQDYPAHGRRVQSAPYGRVASGRLRRPGTRWPLARDWRLSRETGEDQKTAALWAAGAAGRHCLSTRPAGVITQASFQEGWSVALFCRACCDKSKSRVSRFTAGGVRAVSKSVVPDYLRSGRLPSRRERQDAILPAGSASYAHRPAAGAAGVIVIAPFRMPSEAKGSALVTTLAQAGAGARSR